MTEEQDRCRAEFEAWAILPPKLSIEKDGDGEYEDAQTRWLYRAFEVGFRKGAWHGAANMQKQCELDYAKLAAFSELLEALTDVLDNAEPDYDAARRVVAKATGSEAT